jgi:hypothetical protein
MQHLEGSGTPVLYIGRTVLKGSMQPEWGTHHSKRVYTQPFFTPLSLTPICFNAPCQFTSLLNLRPVIFGSTPYGQLLAIMPNHYL